MSDIKPRSTKKSATAQVPGPERPVLSTKVLGIVVDFDPLSGKWSAEIEGKRATSASWSTLFERIEKSRSLLRVKTPEKPVRESVELFALAVGLARGFGSEDPTGASVVQVKMDWDGASGSYQVRQMRRWGKGKGGALEASEHWHGRGSEHLYLLDPRNPAPEGLALWESSLAQQALSNHKRAMGEGQLSSGRSAVLDPGVSIRGAWLKRKNEQGRGTCLVALTRNPTFGFGKNEDAHPKIVVQDWSQASEDQMKDLWGASTVMVADPRLPLPFVDRAELRARSWLPDEGMARSQEGQVWVGLSQGFGSRSIRDFGVFMNDPETGERVEVATASSADEAFLLGGLLQQALNESSEPKQAWVLGAMAEGAWGTRVKVYAQAMLTAAPSPSPASGQREYEKVVGESKLAYNMTQKEATSQGFMLLRKQPLPAEVEVAQLTAHATRKERGDLVWAWMPSWSHDKAYHRTSERQVGDSPLAPVFLAPAGADDKALDAVTLLMGKVHHQMEKQLGAQAARAKEAKQKWDEVRAALVADAEAAASGEGEKLTVEQCWTLRENLLKELRHKIQAGPVGKALRQVDEAFREFVAELDKTPLESFPVASVQVPEAFAVKPDPIATLPGGAAPRKRKPS